MTDRPHCLNRDACAAKTPGRHCKRCSAIHALSTVDHTRRIERMTEAFSDPEYLERLSQRAKEQRARERGNPAMIEVRKEQGHKLYREYASRDDVKAKQLRPEAKARQSESGRRAAEIRMAWCPSDLRAEYVHLMRSKKLPKEEARRIIEDIIARRSPESEARRAINEFNAAQRARAERERQQAY